MTIRSFLFDWRKLLIYSHRWLGIFGCVLFVVWFFSGVVMMYWRMPLLKAEERLMRLPQLNLGSVTVAPGDAAGKLKPTPERVRISMLGNRPVYRFLSGQNWTTVFADNGETLRDFSAEQALDLMRHLVPEHASTIRYDSYLIDSDQWTLSNVIRAQMPMHLIGIGDAEDSYYYVSVKTGEPVMKTTRDVRFWAYLGAVLHWTYFTPFRRQATLWDQSIIWLSFFGCISCISGLIAGIWRYSLSSRFRIKGVHAHSPYVGMMMWHHYAGLIFGFVSFTWILSGGLSLNPMNWSPGTSATRQQRQAVSGGPLAWHLLTPDTLRKAADVMSSSFPPKEFEVVQFRGEPFLMAYRAPSAGEADQWTNTDLSAFMSQQLRLDHGLVSAAAPERGAITGFDENAILDAALNALPGTTVEDAVWLQDYDSYYYDRHGARPLPVLRVRYADPNKTWLYLDPGSGLIAQKQERLTRLNRWLYKGLHSLDFPVLYYRRPLWDIVVILLSIGGLVLSVVALWPSWRRLRRHMNRLGRLAGRLDGTAQRHFALPKAGAGKTGFTRRRMIKD